jgi:hypothetical protein
MRDALERIPDDSEIPLSVENVPDWPENDDTFSYLPADADNADSCDRSPGWTTDDDSPVDGIYLAQGYRY